MIKLVIQIDAPLGTVEGVKEDLAMYLERFWAVKITSVIEISPEQMRIGM